MSVVPVFIRSLNWFWRSVAFRGADLTPLESFYF
jgi:hypothetical protein